MTKKSGIAANLAGTNRKALSRRIARWDPEITVNAIQAGCNN
jgi:hypothetical protein